MSPQVLNQGQLKTATIAPQFMKANTSQVMWGKNAYMLQNAMLNVKIAQVSNAPIFTKAPNKAGMVAKSTSGQLFFVPTIQLGRKGKDHRWPDIFINKKNGKTFLQGTFEILRPPPLAKETLSLPTTEIKVTLNSKNLRKGTLPVNFIEVLPAEEEKDSQIVSRLMINSEVDLDEILGVFQEDPKATFSIYAQINYRLQTRTKATSKKAPVPPKNLRVMHKARSPVAPKGTVLQARMRVRDDYAANYVVMNRKNLYQYAYAKPTVNKPTSQTNVQVKAIKTNISLGTISAYFPLLNKENHPIYAEVNSAYQVIADMKWINSPHGYFRQSPLPDQFFILPDGYGLAFDNERQLPKMDTIFIKKDGEEPDVFRIRFVISPWFDLDRLGRLRDFLGGEGHSQSSFPDLVLGGYESIKFSITSLLKDLGINSVDGSIDSGKSVVPMGFECVIDTSDGGHRLVATSIVNTALEGKVEFILHQDESSRQLQEVPVKLQLAKPATHPVLVEVVPPEEGQAPDSARITNPSTFAITVDSLNGSLLVQDENMSYPLEVIKAACDPPNLQLGAQESKLVKLSPKEGLQEKIWGAMALDLVGVQLTIDPREALDRVYQFSPTSELQSKIRVWSYLLSHPERLPESRADLYGIEVEVRQKEKQPIAITITLDEPEKEVDIAFSWSDILEGSSLNDPTYEVRQRNLLGMGPETWSEWRTNRGREIGVAP